MLPTLQQMEDLVRERTVVRVKHPSDPLALFTYGYPLQFGDVRWDARPEYRWARGVVYDLGTGLPVSYPFRKFFNYGEPIGGSLEGHDVFEAEILEKLDGSMGHIFLNPYTQHLEIATPGAFESPQAQWGTQQLRRLAGYDAMRQAFVGGEIRTLIAEIVYADSRQVVQYEQDGLYLIAGRAGFDRHFSHRQLVQIAERFGFVRAAKNYVDDMQEMTIGEIREFVERLSGEEGVVLFWPDTGHRLKFKSEEYVRAHRVKNSVHPRLVYDAFTEHQTETAPQILTAIHNTIGLIAEEYREPFDVFQCDLIREYNEICRRIEAEPVSAMEHREMYEHFVQHYGKLAGAAKGYYLNRSNTRLFHMVFREVYNRHYDAMNQR